MSYLTNPYRYVSAVSWSDFDQLLAYWKFNEASGDIINNATSVGSSHALSSVDIGITGATYQASGIIDYAVSFDGINDYGECGTSLSVWNFLRETNTKWTLATWVYFTDTITGQLFSDVDSTQADGIQINFIGYNEIQFELYAGTSDIVGTGWGAGYGGSISLAEDTWYNMVWTVDQTTASGGIDFWLNGVSQGTRSQNSNSGSSDDSEFSLKTCRRGGENNKFVPCRQCETSFWGRILPSTGDNSIETLYNSGSGLAL